MQLNRLGHTNICDSRNEKVLVNISHTSCTRNVDHRVVLIKTGSTQNERMMSQTIIRTFKKCKKRGGETQSKMMAVPK